MKKSSKSKLIKHIDLTKIENPNFLKDLSYEELDVLSEDIKDYILDVTSKNGGHLSSNLGVRDLTIALCRSFDFSKDKIIFDVGHQSYTYKILTGRKFDTLRQENGISGFQKMSESPYDHYEAGHSSTSISAASGLALARDLKGEHYNIVAFIGDASIVNGLSLEALNYQGSSDHKIIIVVNINDMSIGVPSGAVSQTFRKLSTSRLYSKSKHAYKRLLSKTTFGKKLYYYSVYFKNWLKRGLIRFSMFDNMGYKIIGPIDGHNIKALEKALSTAKQQDRSVIVMTKTVKGKGYEPAENDKTGKWHGVGPFDIKAGEFKANPDCISYSEVYAKKLYDFMDKNEKVVTIVPATGYGSALTSIQEKFPKRFFDVGIAEEHAAVLAAGLSIGSFHPVYSVYSTFMQRAYDEISHDLARMKCSSTILIDRAGLVGATGETHQGLYDEQFLFGIPNTVITMPSSPNQITALLNESLNNHGVFAIRYPKGKVVDKEYSDENVSFGEWKYEITSANKKTAIISLGPVVEELKDALNGHDVTLVNAIYQKPLNEKVINDLLSYKKIIIHDIYSNKYGFPSYVAARLMELSYKGEVIIKSIDNSFVGQGDVNNQLEDFDLNVESIIKLI